MEIPPEVGAYGPQLGGSTTGKQGVLELKMARDSKTARTIVLKQYSQVPLFAQKAMYLEKSLPAMAYMYIMSPSGGVLQGDSYRIDVSLSEGAMAHLTTQGATRIYRMEKGFATQQVDLAAGAGCYLEYMPDQIIPYGGSRFYQKTAIRAHCEATIVYSEILAPGRVAMGESFQYDICYLRVEAADEKGRRKFSDGAMLEPEKRDMRAAGIMEQDVVGSIYIITPSRFVAELEKKIAAAIQNCGIAAAGCSILPHDCGVAARMLGKTAGNVRSAMHSVAAAARAVVLGAQFSVLRKG
jgi:urease accessory protein